MPTVYQRKRALVIGIDNYRVEPLKYCVNDAQDLKKALVAMDFEVTLILNCDYCKFFNEVDQFIAQITHSDLTLFYFAGHGKQMDEQNFLLPSNYDYDYRHSESKYLSENAVNVRYITKAIDEKSCCVTIYMFDCCRNNVCTRSPDQKQGLSAIHGLPETLVVFSCAPGKAAMDETYNGRNGVFMGSLLQYITESHNHIEELLRNVARDVKNQTNGFQLPYRTSSFTDSVYLLNDKQEPFGVHSRRPLKCHGRPCDKCGHCRDWRQCGIDSSDGFPVYEKRACVTCCGAKYAYHDGHGHLYDSVLNGFGSSSICTCPDNV
ncbi:unnamed protein product [Adineta ricciae]|uniref:Peptidase C14 caspase domain-containing protein n=1 Tax=Adineta ricciae TaxID=249248 RepID=A0A813WYV8_ADIRI|nr:unnamed protein product [Adineta ricciae]CAF1007742.1 unnamed protein product [Adineta ricciae]